MSDKFGTEAWLGLMTMFGVVGGLWLGGVFGRHRIPVEATDPHGAIAYPDKKPDLSIMVRKCNGDKDSELVQSVIDDDAELQIRGEMLVMSASFLLGLTAPEISDQPPLFVVATDFSQSGECHLDKGIEIHGPGLSYIRNGYFSGSPEAAFMLRFHEGSGLVGLQ